MATLVGHSLATQINWKGTNKKRAFQHLKLRRVVTGQCFLQKEEETVVGRLLPLQAG